MTNTRESDGSHGWGGEEMTMHNHELVRDHIDDLLHEGDVLRVARQLAAHRSLAEVSVPATTGGRRFGVVRPARIRVGRWLVGIGWAVAGCGGNAPVEAHATGGHAGHAH
jgi:hypothetical protein